MKEIRAGQEETKTNQAELLAKIEADRKADQEKAEADRRDLKEMMKMMHANQAKTETRHKYFLARMDADWKAWREIMNANYDETMACQEIEARQEEKKPTSSDRKPEAAEQREVPAEDAKVMPIGEPKKKRRRDRKLATERRRQKPKEFTMGKLRNPEEIGRSPQRDEPPCNSGTAKGQEKRQ
jgi:hypothetical protein